MNYPERLMKLHSKHIKNSKINKEESKEAKELIYDIMIKQENIDDDIIKLIMDFSPGVGIAAFKDYLNMVTEEEVERSLLTFLNSVDFRANKNNKGLKRGMALVVMLYNDNFSLNLLGNTFTQVCEVAMNTSKSGVNKQITEYVYRELFQKIEDRFFEESYDSETFNEKQFYNIERIFINTAFSLDDNKICISPKVQMMTFKWLLGFNKAINVEKEEKKLLNNHIKKWPLELKLVLTKKSEIMNSYGKYLDNIFDNENSISGDGDEGNNHIDKTTKSEESKDRKTEAAPVSSQEKEIVKDEDKNISNYLEYIDNYITKVRKRIYILTKELKTSNANLDFYKFEYEKLKSENENHKAKLNLLQEEKDKSCQKNNILVAENEDMNEKIVCLEGKYDEYQNQVKALLETNNIIETTSLQDFKNKLSAKLRNEYLDFKEVKNEDIDLEMAEVLKIKLSNIFKELERQGINF